jgi:ethanolamine utilization protein EutA
VRLRRHGEHLTSRYIVVERETLYQSPVALTPYQSDERIDEQAVGDIVDSAYAAAGLHPDSVDTGAVILTGEALRRENAEALAEVLAYIGGEFVCAAAGHHMEAMLAAYGSGSAMASHEQGVRILNVDIGGGTTKLALVEDGRVTRTAAIHIGGRLLAIDECNRITRLDAGGKRLAALAGYSWDLGDVVTPSDLDRLAGWMADALITAIVERPSPPQIEALYLTAPLEASPVVDRVRFSGGVAEYVYRREERDFGDLGLRLGQRLRARIDAGRLPWPLMPAGECIRATALGASEYSVQLSGNTVYVSDPGALLPRRNLQVLQPKVSLAARIDPAEVARAVRDHLAAFDVVEGESEFALAFRWREAPSFERLSAFAAGIVAALPATIANAKPIYVIVDGDVAQNVGALLKDELKVASEVLVIDGVTLWDFDYIDLGRIRMPSCTVPVTIKSLVFGEDPRLPHRHSHHHP